MPQAWRVKMLTLNLKPISILQMCSAVAILVMGIVTVINNSKKLKNWAFFIGTITVFLWLTNTSVFLSNIDKQFLLQLYKTYGFLGVAFIAPSVFLITVSVLEAFQKHKIEVIVFYSISSIFYILNSIFPVFDVRYTYLGYYTKYGIFGLIFIIYFTVVMLYSFVLLFLDYKKEINILKKRQLGLFTIALLIAFTGSVDYALWYDFNVYPFGFASILVFCIIDSIAIIKYKFLVLEPEMAYETVFNSLASFIIGVDLEDNIKFVNQATLEVLNYKKEDLIGKPLDFIITQKDDYEKMKDKLSEGKDVTDVGETYLVTSEKRYIPVRFIISPIKESAKNTMTLGLVIIAQDITDLIKAENELVKSEARLKKILQTASEGFWLIDNQSITLDVNPYICKILGRGREEIIGHNIFEFTDEKGKTILKKQIELRNEGKESSFEVDFITKDGSKIPCLLNATPLYDKGEKIGSFAMITNISKLKKLENKLREYSKDLENKVNERTKALSIVNEQLKKANEIKSNFLANVSHELRTPLTSIRSFSEILLDYKDEEETTRDEFLRIINEESERLTRLINDVLDISKIEAGKMEWEDDFNYIEDLMSEALDLILPLANKKSITIEKKIAQNLPPIFVDKDRIKQVISNLLDNAVKFTNSGKIQIGAKMQDESILCYVSDSGIGIPDDFQSKIFERFEQVGADILSEKKTKGTGLGLSICKDIIEHYGGKIWVESQVDKGSTFFFSLPIKSIESKTTQEVFKTTFLSSRKKILVVDDDDNVRRLLNFELSKAGYKVIEEFNGNKTLTAINNTKPDLIILDILLPGLDGYDILDKIKENPEYHSIPIIILTGLEDNEKKAIRLGADYFMTKPVDRAILLEKIRRLLKEGGEKLLIIDDDIDFISAVKFYLEKKGYRVYTAYDGEEGIKACQIVKPDLIILDILMPKKNGINTLKSLKKDKLIKNIPVIVLTVNAIENGRTKCLALGAKRYITKKENLNALLKQIKEVLESKEKEGKK